MNIASIKRYRDHKRITAGLILSILAGFFIVGFVVPKVLAVDTVFDQVVYKVSNPNTDRSILTIDKSEALNMSQHGYTEIEPIFMASATSKPGLKPVYRIDSTSDLSKVNSVYTLWESERDNAVSKYNYTAKGISFYVSQSSRPDTTPIYRLSKNTTHTVVFGKSAADKLAAQGWNNDGMSFHAMEYTKPTNTTYDQVVYRVANPSTSRSILTTNQAEVDSMKNHGYTEVEAVFMASTTSKPGLKPIYRIDSTTDLSKVNSTYTAWASERDSAVDKLNYIDKGIAFFASETAKIDTKPVYRLYKSGAFNVALGKKATDTLVAAGWSNNGIKFHAAVVDDTTTPTVSVTAPADRSTVTVGDIVTVTASASDDSGVSKVEFLVNGDVKSTDTSAPYTYDWDAKNLTPGSEYTLTSKAYDAVGNVATSAPVTVTAQLAKTSLHVTDVTDTTAVLNWTNVPGVTGYLVGRSGDDTRGNGPWQTTDPASATSRKFVWLEPGTTYTLFAEPQPGGERVEVEVTTKDSVAPKVAITTPADNSTFKIGDTVNISAEASDNVGVSKVEFLVNGDVKSTDTTAPYAYDWNTAGLTADDTYTLTAKAYDAAGNETTSASVSAKAQSIKTKLTVSDVTDTTVVLHWTGIPNSTGYTVGRSGEDTRGNGPWQTTDPASATSREFVWLKPSTTYTLFVKPQPGGERVEVEVTTKDSVTPTDPYSPFTLDDTGKTIPDTNYAIPSGAIFMSTTGNDSNPGTKDKPVRTLNKAIDSASVGGTIVIRGGVYRDSYHGSAGPYYYRIATKKLTYQAYPHEQVWFDGSEVQAANSWKSDDNGRWYKNWDTPQFCDGKYYDFKYNNQSKTGNLTGASGRKYTSNTGPCSHWDVYGNKPENYPAAGDPQLLVVDGKVMEQVHELNLAKNGKFFYDWAAKRIYISSNPDNKKIELAVRPNALVVGGGVSDGTIVRGIGFRHYATNEYSNLTHAALYMGGKNFTVENAVFTENAAGSLSMAPMGSTMNHVTQVNNGFSSSGGNGHSEGGGPDNVMIKNNLISNNNTEHFGLNCSLSCGQAGMKMAHMKGFTIKNNIFKNNEGSGFWCDMNCSDGVMVNNLIMNNTSHGIFYEISSKGIIASNLLIDNEDGGMWVDSATTKVYNNTVVTDKANQAIWISDDARNACDHRNTNPGPNTTGIELVNNVTYNRNKTVSSVMASGKDRSCGNTLPDQLFDKFDYNAYYRENGLNTYALIRWSPGTTTGTPGLKWKTLAPFTAAKGWESHGIDITTGSDPFFTNRAAGDYRIRSDSPAYKSGTALPRDVADAIGVPTSAGQNRGALVWPQK